MPRSRFALLNDFVDALARRDRTHPAREQTPSDEVAERALARPALERAITAVTVLMGHTGDASRIAIAEQALSAYADLTGSEKSAFFNHLRDACDVEASRVHDAYQTWSADPSPVNASTLSKAVQPTRQEVLRRLNLAPGATPKLVQMRADLLTAMKTDATLMAVDQDFAHLLTAWFNRGFLSMRRVDWSSSAAVLEKITSYETVHPMRGWKDLRRRLNAHDRRLYAFFHPATGDEPLIFVEVALTKGVPGAIADILTAPPPSEPIDADTAVFYSINNTLTGLHGVSFGNFLIKQVVTELTTEMPHLRTFVTLSPVPGFAVWLCDSKQQEDRQLVARLDSTEWHTEPHMSDQLRPQVEAAAARYLVRERDRRGRPLDPVARFHLGNGASAWRVNWPADLSLAALRRSYGLMVNYLYDPESIETQHEAFVRDGSVAHGPQLARLLPPVESFAG